MTQHEYPFLVPIEFSDAMAKRLSWKGQYFTASGVICFEKLSTSDEVEKFAHAIPCAVRLTPFRDEFKSKLFASLGNDTVLDSESVGAFFSYDLFTGKIATNFEVHTQDVKLEGGRVLASATGQENIYPVTAEEKNELVVVLEKFAKTNIFPQMQDSLACFYPDHFSIWRDRLASADVRNPDVIPWPSLFPSAIPLTIERGDDIYYAVDHYAIDPAQTQVLFLIFKEDEESEKDVLWGGFRYCLQSQKIKTLSDLPGKFNASQWLKELDNSNPFAFNILLSARRDFFTKYASQIIKPTRKGP